VSNLRTATGWNRPQAVFVPGREPAPIGGAGEILLESGSPMLRKWLSLGLMLAVLYAVSKLNTRRWRDRYPVIRRIDRMITILAWTLLAAYVISFLYWLYTRVVR
jgi:hypothetical protein